MKAADLWLPGPPDRKGEPRPRLFRPRREKAIPGADEVGAHEIAGGSSVAFCDRVVNCRMLDEDVLKSVAGALERETMEAHADGDVLLEGLHGGRKVWVRRGLGDREVKHEVGIRAVHLPMSGVA